MKKLFLLCLFGALPAFAQSVETAIGETSLSIPAPDGFSAVTPAMKPYADIAKRWVPETNEPIALFLPKPDIATAAQGGTPIAARKLEAQIAKQLIPVFATTADFAQVKQTLKSQNQQIAKEIDAKMPGLIEKITGGLNQDYHVDLNAQLAPMIPLPPHEETERTLAYSLLLKMTVNNGSGGTVQTETAVTATFLHVKGKIIYLYASAAKEDFAWTRSVSKTWAESILAANPSTGDIASRESVARKTAIDWSEVMTHAAIGAVVGGVLWLIRAWWRKRQAA